MRWLIVATAITLGGTAVPAHADTGIFMTEGFGGAAYRGELSRWDGAPRFHVGFEARRGPWSIELFGAGTIPDFGFIDCYGEECAYAAKPVASLVTYGADLRERWRIVSSPYFKRPGIFLTLHGGPRYVEGGDALQSYRGVGVGAGASIDLDIWVIGYYLDFGTDLMRLSGPNDDVVHGSTPYVMLGAKLGWL